MAQNVFGLGNKIKKLKFLYVALRTNIENTVVSNSIQTTVPSLHWNHSNHPSIATSVSKPNSYLLSFKPNLFLQKQNNCNMLWTHFFINYVSPNNFFSEQTILFKASSKWQITMKKLLRK